MPRQPVLPPSGPENHPRSVRHGAFDELAIRNLTLNTSLIDEPSPSLQWASSQFTLDYAYRHGIYYPSALLAEAGEALS